METTIGFFSSDARPLYTRDVFRAMSYPKDFVIQFRYSPEHINGDPTKMINKKGVIFLSTGNDLTKIEADRTISNISIREVTIIHQEKATDTNRIHFFLKLGEFKKYEIVGASNDILPPKKFVSELNVDNIVSKTWGEIIDIIKPSFPKTLFYKFNFINRGDETPLQVMFDQFDKQSYYELTDENNYTLKMAFYDTEANDSKEYHSLRIKSLNDQLINVSAPELVKIEARKDNRIYSVFTKSISASNLFTYINFETIIESTDPSGQTNNTPLVDTTVKISIKKSKWKVTSFAFWSVIAAISIGYGKIISDNIKLDGVFSWSLTLQLLFAGILGFLSASQLYKFFDKK